MCDSKRSPHGLQPAPSQAAHHDPLVGREEEPPAGFSLGQGMRECGLVCVRVRAHMTAQLWKPVFPHSVNGGTWWVLVKAGLKSDQHGPGWEPVQNRAKSPKVLGRKHTTPLLHPSGLGEASPGVQREGQGAGPLHTLAACLCLHARGLTPAGSSAPCCLTRAPGVAVMDFLGVSG